MQRGGRLEGWETLAAGLAAGLLAHAAPWAAAVLLAAAFAALVRANQIVADGAAPLLALYVLAVAAILWGVPGAVTAALVWRVGAELVAHGRACLSVHLWTAPAAALAHRLDLPALLIGGLACIALVAWIDWIVRQLAAWRLDAASSDDAGAFVGAQAAVLAPLLIFPTPAASLAMLVATGLARQLRWDAARAGAYATAR